MPGYIFDQAWDDERKRLASIEALWDAGTKRSLDRVGTTAGWRCLEVGAGAGSIARWLAERVGPAGRVVATDIDTRFIDEFRATNLEVRRHDIVTDDLVDGDYDLIHARCLLEHLPARDAVLKKLVSALKPGGWIVVEDTDMTAVPYVPSTKWLVRPSSQARLFVKVTRAFHTLLRAAGHDAEYGGRLPGTLAEHGLVDVGGEAVSPFVRGGTVESEFYRLTLDQVRGAMTTTGLLTDGEVDRALRNNADPECGWLSVPVVSAWGRRPL